MRIEEDYIILDNTILKTEAWDQNWKLTRLKNRNRNFVSQKSQLSFGDVRARAKLRKNCRVVWEGELQYWEKEAKASQVLFVDVTHQHLPPSTQNELENVRKGRYFRIFLIITRVHSDF